jgi:hypothetical protein
LHPGKKKKTRWLGLVEWDEWMDGWMDEWVGVSDHKLNFLKGLFKVQYYHPRKDLIGSNGKKRWEYSVESPWEQQTPNWEYAKMLFFQVKNKPKAYSLGLGTHWIIVPPIEECTISVSHFEERSPGVVTVVNGWMNHCGG